jgi:hypothetical protein
MAGRKSGQLQQEGKQNYEQPGGNGTLDSSFCGRLLRDGFASFRLGAEMSAAKCGAPGLFVGQGLLIRFMSTLPAHMTAIIKAMTRRPLIRGKCNCGEVGATTSFAAHALASSETHL